MLPLKYLSIFGRPLEIPLINCKVELKLKWKKQCVLNVMKTPIIILIVLFLL